jgi:hypothetical protein
LALSSTPSRALGWYVKQAKSNIANSGVPRRGVSNSPRNSEVLTKLSRIPSPVENISVTT